MNKRNKLKAIVLSIGLAAMMVPATLNAQINRGLLQNPYKDHDDSRHGMMNSQGNRGGIIDDNSGDGFTIETFGDTNVPLGSGIAILMGLGLGYVALKKKEDEQ